MTAISLILRDILFCQTESRYMEKHNDIRKRIASLTSNILNPFLLCLALIFIFAFTSTSSTPEAIKWGGY